MSTLWFNIGSVDSFERNLEVAQMELNFEPENYIPVIYKQEVEISQFGGALSSILMIGFFLYMMKKTAGGMMGGRKGKGLFGVMESTAKLINSNDIGVRFK